MWSRPNTFVMVAAAGCSCSSCSACCLLLPKKTHVSVQHCWLPHELNVYLDLFSVCYLVVSCCPSSTWCLHAAYWPWAILSTAVRSGGFGARRRGRSLMLVVLLFLFDDVMKWCYVRIASASTGGKRVGSVQCRCWCWWLCGYVDACGHHRFSKTKIVDTIIVINNNNKNSKQNACVCTPLKLRPSWPTNARLFNQIRDKQNL